MRNTNDGRTLNTTVYERLREDVLTGKLLPGQRLKVSLLADVLAVSANVVREALNRLGGEQLVEIEPQHGFTVRGLSADDLIDLVRQRVIFEGIALRQAIATGDVNWQSKVVAAHHRLSRTPMAMGRDLSTLNPEWLARHEEFNFAMLQACGSPRLLQIVRQLAEGSAIYYRALLPAASEPALLENEHSQLLDAILSGDADKAAGVLTMHLEQTRDIMLPLLTAASKADAKTFPGERVVEAPKPGRAKPPAKKVALKRTRVRSSAHG
jgi:GntR family transcriptional regulator, carbon starvation induced regulator